MRVACTGNFSLWVNDSLPSMFTIIKHIKGKVSFFLSKVLLYENNAQTHFYRLHGFSVQKKFFFFLKHLSLRMDLMCRGSEKLMLYRLFSADLDERVLKGKCKFNLLSWVYYEEWLLLRFPVFQPLLLEYIQFSVLLSKSLIESM